VKKDHKKTPQNEHQIELNGVGVFSAISLSHEGEGVSLGAGSPWLGVFAQVLF
jgi:hypothetical protein